MRTAPTGVVGAVRSGVSGGVLLSHTVSRAVPSALKGLTSGFGMGPGVSPSLRPPERFGQHPLGGVEVPECVNAHSVMCVVWFSRPLFLVGVLAVVWEPHRDASIRSSFRLKVCGVFKPLGLLVPVNSTPYGASISGLSTQWSSWGPYTPHGGGRSHLEEGFPLRCFQRLSRPNVANQPCHWHDNWHTRGSSVPVLSY
jgi:hypothetical protein